MKHWTPKFIAPSRIPEILSKLAPINIWAISFGFWVWSRHELDDNTRRHETIHFQQQLELLFIGQWILYLAFYLFWYVKFRGDGKRAYMRIPFEMEAYKNQNNINYLKERKRYNWLNLT